MFSICPPTVLFCYSSAAKIITATMNNKCGNGRLFTIVVIAGQEVCKTKIHLIHSLYSGNAEVFHGVFDKRTVPHVR